jgi:putative ABC transport system permease protein
MALSDILRQSLAVSLINARALPLRVRSYWTAILGFAATAAVITAIFAIQAGFTKALVSVGRQDVAIVTAAGAKTEFASFLTSSDVVTVNSILDNLAPGSSEMTSAEVLTTASVPIEPSNSSRNIAFRGVQAQSFQLYPHVRITQGRAFQSGLNEVIVGARLAAELPDLALGSRVRLGGAAWSVVGILESSGDLHESEIWADVGTVQSTFNRGNVFQSMRLSLPSDPFLVAFSDAVQRDPRVNVQIERERDFFAEQSGPISRFIGLVGRFIAILMGAGAAFTIVSAMQTVIAEREPEIAVLRVMGFGHLSVLTAIVMEGVVLGSVGGLLGALIAYVAVNGLQASTLAFGMTSQLYFTFAVTPSLIQVGTLYALGLGLIGALVPAVQIVRRPIVSGLRS